MITAININAPKLGRFSFLLSEIDDFRKLTQDQLIESLKADFEDLTRDQLVYLTNCIQVYLMFQEKP